MNQQQLSLSQSALVAAWRENLPAELQQGDSVIVRGDAADAQALTIHIDAAGHTQYSFDFKCTYLDDRSVRVDLIDAEQDDVSIDEATPVVQELVADYTRHIHECAQTLQAITHQ
ncbi:MAG: hypothetical protein E6X17_13095 [Sporomusaceae bacterium]|nr:hypothetical protein [Sporomusaceae bacterium]